MKILVNATNLKTGGALQVADSICALLNDFPEHYFFVVLSDRLDTTAQRIQDYRNVTIYRYNISNSLGTILLGRDSFLDNMVRDNGINCVLTIFGPSRWNPKVPHVSGFAIPYLALGDSPYYQTLHLVNLIKTKLYFAIVEWAFKRSTKYFYTENEYISMQLKKKWHGYNITTITNYYNQIFDDPQKWVHIDIPQYKGISILCVSANYPHKNLTISIDIARYLKKRYPDFKFRFVFTLSEKAISIPDDLKEHFLLLGQIDISQCPKLYQSAGIVFQPSLLECFTATYPEAMKMGVPIVTTDLEYARGLCGNAAVYYSALNAEAAAERIYEVSMDEILRKTLVDNGNKRLAQFDTFKDRARKIITLCEKIAK